MQYRWLHVALLLPCLALPAQANIFTRKKDKPDPKSRVPELIAVLQSDGDADKRARAAEELRNYDAGVHPEIVPALINALHNDQKPNVRSEAAQSLGKIRPVSQAAGEALEQAQANDPSMRVRLQARSTLLHYHWAGYRSKKTDVPPLPTTSKEPPVVNTKAPPASPTPRPMPALRPTPAKTQPTTVPAALTPATPS